MKENIDIVTAENAIKSVLLGHTETKSIVIQNPWGVWKTVGINRRPSLASGW